jgi:hypothetical protein
VSGRIAKDARASLLTPRFVIPGIALIVAICVLVWIIVHF